MLYNNAMMKKYIYIGAGAALGAVLRYGLTAKAGTFSGFHWDTFLINISGCFLLAFFLSFAMVMTGIGSNLRLGIATGVLGAFTTFSTISSELGNSIVNGLYIQALLYSVVTIISGFAAIYIGLSTARWVIKMRTSGGKTR